MGCESWKGSAPPRCCTSIFPTAWSARSRARAGRGCRATRSSCATRTVMRFASASPASCGCAATRTRRSTGTGRTRRVRRCAEGWIYTGDRFREDADGYYWFEGRADDLVKVSGQWVHPMEVERALAEHPTVRECAVLARRGRKPADDAEEHTSRFGRAMARAPRRRKRCKISSKRALVPFKYPRTIEYLDELPKTGTDKIDRQRLRVMGKGRRPRMGGPRL